MSKIILPLLALLFSSTVLVGQNGGIYGSLTDASDGSPLIGANVVISSNKTNYARGTMTDFEGNFKFENIAKDTIILKISYLGYQDFSKEIYLNEENINLGKLALMEKVVELNEAVLTGVETRVIQKGDTLQYNASAYKTLPDASAEDLLEKMPTVVIENGKIQAEGEEVKQVLVDGKRFFGDDPTAAIKNLPSEVIDKIEIFDQQSEQAQFTGFDDGNTSKTINIVTKGSMRNGQFGKIYGGYGTDEKYQIGGNINVFNGDQRISIIGMSNNINQQNFSSDDLLGVVGSSGGGRGVRGGGGRGRGGGQRGGSGGGNSGSSTSDFMVGQQSGISESQAFGINVSDEFGDKVDLSASYFFNRTENVNEQLTNQQFFDADGFNELYNERSNSNSANINHRLNARLKFEINEFNSLVWKSTVSFQDNKGMEAIFGQNFLGADVLNQADNNLDADYSALNLNNDLTWMHKFSKPRRTLSIRFNSGYSPKNGESTLYSLNSLGEQTDDITIIDQFSTLDQSNGNASANIQYTEPLGQNSMLMLNSKTSYQQEESNKEVVDFNEETDQYDLFNENLSNVFSNDYFTQQLGGGYNYRKGSLMFMARANVQWANLLNEQTVPYENTYNNTFLNLLPTAMLRYNISKTENIRVTYRTNTQLPSIQQLQNVIDNSNPLQLTVGNPDLDQSYQHSLFARYSNANTEKGSVFFAMLGGSLTNDYVSNSTYLSNDENPVLAIENGAILTLPVNLDGQWNVRSFLTYGFPVAALKSNLNIDLTSNFARTPGMVSEELNFSNNTTVGLGVTLGSNFSDRIDFTVSTRSNYNTVNNSLLTSGNTNYFNQNTRVKLNTVVLKGLVFRTDLTHQYYTGFEDDFNQNYLLWNLSIGKKLFKNDRGEISLSVFDVLNENNSISRNATETYIEDVQTNVLQRYFMLGFKYDLRHFKVKNE